MTQHQAPEVTSEMAAIIERLCRKRQVYNGRNTFRYEFVNPDGPEIAKLLTRATQPLSLTVDPVLAFEEYWGASKYRTRNMIGYSDKKCLAWEAYSAALQSLSLPVDIDRSGLAQEVDDITYAGVGP